MMREIGAVVILFLLISGTLHAQKGADKIISWEAEADSLVGQQKFLEALKLYDKIISTTKLKKEEDFRILYDRAFTRYNLQRHDEALEDVNLYLSKFEDPQGRFLRVYINQELGNNEAQFADLNDLLKLNPNPDLIKWRASLAMQTGNYAIAQKDLEALIKEQPIPELQAYLALAYYYQEKVDSALITLDEIATVHPTYMQAYEYATSICLESGEPDLALEYINKGLAQDPENGMLHFYKGIALVEKENMDEACRSLSKAFYHGGVDDASDYLKEYCFGVSN